MLLLLSALVENGAGTGWVRDLIIEDFECKDSILVLSSCNLVLWDNNYFNPTYGKKFLNKYERDMIKLTSYNRDMLIGLILSDGCIEKNKGWNPRIRIEQTFPKNFKFVWFIFNKLSLMTHTYPLLIKKIFNNKVFFSLAFRTRQLECLNEIYALFYNTRNKTKTKVINEELFFYFNPIVLAYWIMGDGSKTGGGGLILCTDSFSLKDIILLMNILKIKFDIDATIYWRYSISPKDRKTILNNNIKQGRIYINKKNYNKIKYLIKPYFTEDFLYKL